MDIDFHYYVAYCAARVAGFTKQASLLLAQHSQYTDEARLGNTRLAKGARVTKIEPTCTSDLRCSAVNSNGYSRDTVEPWVACHFLPGNFYTNRYDHVSQEVFARNAMSGNKDLEVQLTTEEQWRTKMICDHSTPLSQSMMSDCAKSFRAPRDCDPWAYRLALLGIRMHVFADTFAHAGFAGVLSKKIAGISHVSAIASVEEVRRKGAVDKWHALVDFGTFSMNKHGTLKLGKLSANVYLPHWTGIKWQGGSHVFKGMETLGGFGHGCIGHLPDIPCVRYCWRRDWDSRVFVRDNPKVYEQAFKSLVDYVKTVAEFWQEQAIPDDDSVYTKKDIFGEAPTKPLPPLTASLFARCGSNTIFYANDDEYKKACQKRYKYFENLVYNWDAEPLGDYKGDKLFLEWGKSKQPKSGPARMAWPITNFNAAAKHHKNWVEQQLHREFGINIFDASTVAKSDLDHDGGGKKTNRLKKSLL